MNGASWPACQVEALGDPSSSIGDHFVDFPSMVGGFSPGRRSPRRPRRQPTSVSHPAGPGKPRPYTPPAADRRRTRQPLHAPSDGPLQFGLGAGSLRSHTPLLALSHPRPTRARAASSQGGAHAQPSQPGREVTRSSFAGSHYSINRLRRLAKTAVTPAAAHHRRRGQPARAHAGQVPRATSSATHVSIGLVRVHPGMAKATRRRPRRF